MMTLLSWLIGLGTFVVFAVLIVHLLVALVLIVPAWRICARAGYSGALSLFLLIPAIGAFIVMAMLAFGDWPAGEARAGRR